MRRRRSCWSRRLQRFPGTGSAGRRLRRTTSPSRITMLAADDGRHRPALGLHAVERGPADAGGHVGVADGAAGLQVDDGQVGVLAHRHAALAGDAEDALRRRRWSGRRTAPGVSRPSATWVSITAHQGLHARHARRRGRIGPAPFPPACAARGRSRSRRRRRWRSRATARRWWRGVADRRVHLRQALQPLVGLRRGQGQVLRRHLAGGDVLVLAEELDLVGGGDVQHVDALAEPLGDARSAAGSSAARFRRRAPPGGWSSRRSRASGLRSVRRSSSSEWKAARRRMCAQHRLARPRRRRPAACRWRSP